MQITFDLGVFNPVAFHLLFSSLSSESSEHFFKMFLNSYSVINSLKVSWVPTISKAFARHQGYKGKLHTVPIIKVLVA